MKRPAFILGALALCLLLARIPVLTEVPERDIATYAVIGQGLLNGRSLYADLWDHKPPGVHLVYAAAIAMTGEDTRAIYLLSVLGSVFGLLGVWASARQFDGPDRSGAVWAGLMWLGVSGAFRLQGEMPNTELLANGFLALGFYRSLRLLDSEESLQSGLAAGLIFTGASLFKHLLVLIPAALLAVAWLVSRHRQRQILRQGLLWLIAGAAVWGCVAVWFILHGTWPTFYEAVFEYNRFYGGSIGRNLLDSLVIGRLFPPEFRFALPILAFIAVGVTLDRDRRRKWAMLGTYFLASALVVALHPGRYSHYRIVLLVPLCIGFGCAATSFITSISTVGRRVGNAIAAMVLMAVTVPELAALRLPGRLWAIERFGDQFTSAAQLGTFLGDHLPKNCTFFEFGSESQLYFYSRRDPPSGVFYSMPLEQGPLSRKLQHRVMTDLRRKNVCLLVVRNTARQPEPLRSYLLEHYTSTGIRVPLNPGRWLELSTAREMPHPPRLHDFHYVRPR
jgi:hypothetical protein